MAATRVRRTFNYPAESEDDDAVEEGMDEKGNTLLICCYLSQALKTDTLLQTRSSFSAPSPQKTTTQPAFILSSSSSSPSPPQYSTYLAYSVSPPYPPAFLQLRVSSLQHTHYTFSPSHRSKSKSRLPEMQRKRNGGQGPRKMKRGRGGR
jgi:hypothetical protein